MALETKEIIKALGIDIDNADELTIETLTEKVNSKYVPLDGIEKNETVRAKLVGKVLGSASTKTAQLFGLEKSEYEGKPIEEIVKLGKDKLEQQLADAQEQAKAGLDENGKKLAKKLEDLNEKYTAATNGLKEFEQKYNTDLAAKDNALKQYKLTDKVSKIKADKINPLLTDDYHKNTLIQTGFETTFASKYEIDLDETENVIVRSKADGKLVTSKKEAGKPAGIDEIYLQEAEAAGILKKNNAGGAAPVVRVKQPADDNNGAKTVNIHPNAQKRTQKVA